MVEAVQIIHSIFSRSRFALESEKQLQMQIHGRLKEKFTDLKREEKLDASSIVDFLINGSVAVEVKLQGSKTEIYYQCERYTKFAAVAHLILVTNKSVTLPTTINGKPCYTINLSRGWL